MSEARPAGDYESPPAFSADSTSRDLESVTSGDEWMLQAEAADVVGCSVSAIRKWRREGTVRSRRTETSGGMDRVEVLLADVQARAGQRVRPFRAAHAGGAGTVVPPGMVMVPMIDLGELYRRVSETDRRVSDADRRVGEAERRAGEAERGIGEAKRRVGEAEQRVSEAERRAREAENLVSEAERRLDESLSENRLLREQLAETRDRLNRARPGPGARRPEEQRRSRPPAAVRPEPEIVSVVEPPRTPEPPRPGPSKRPRDGTPASPEQPSQPDPRMEITLGQLADELRRLYRSLQAHQRTDSVDPEDHRRWTDELAAYDEALLIACRALHVRLPPEAGPPLQSADRVELTRGLAAAGLDVRVQ